MQDIFLEPKTLILRPKLRSNALYIILIGKVAQLENNQQTNQIIKNILNQKQNSKSQQNRREENDSTFTYLDRELKDFPQENNINE